MAAIEEALDGVLDFGFLRGLELDFAVCGFARRWSWTPLRWEKTAPAVLTGGADYVSGKPDEAAEEQKQRVAHGENPADQKPGPDRRPDVAAPFVL